MRRLHPRDRRFWQVHPLALYRYQARRLPSISTQLKQRRLKLREHLAPFRSLTLAAKKSQRRTSQTFLLKIPTRLEKTQRLISQRPSQSQLCLTNGSSEQLANCTYSHLGAVL